LCIKEILNNIAKHSKASEVVLIVNQNEDLLTIMIEDNGIGRNPEAHNGNGTQTLQMRMSSLGGNVQWHQLQPGCGVELKFQLK
jgi:signal transduction histidine kinase